ncbi:hypothetical protein ACN27G_06310 [Plantactinospora sp. WMMB334]|uniref:aromatic-ring hydroxylase C-terminal domain-containing protein n=1 Tax=Plantactinospora sp. WMMB334 TaxID=3404119 RepID=UPI003B949AE8
MTRSADLLREGRGLLLDLVDRAEVRDAAAAWTARVNTVTRPYGPAGPRCHHAGACAGHLVRPTGLSAALTVASGSLGMSRPRTSDVTRM